MRTRSRRRAAGALLAAGLAAGWGAAPAAAHLVVLVDGSVLKASAFEVEGDRARVVLVAGGNLRLPLLRVERVVDDEVLAEPERGAAELERGAASFELRFAETHERPATAYADLIYAAAQRHQINPGLIAAVIRTESAFNARAVSSKGARGLMQLMPATGRRFGLRTSELFDPAKNIDAGARYLRFLADRFADDLGLVLAGYNAGEGSVDRYRGIPPFRETQGYIRRVYSLLGLELAAPR